MQNSDSFLKMISCLQAVDVIDVFNLEIPSTFHIAGFLDRLSVSSRLVVADNMLMDDRIVDYYFGPDLQPGRRENLEVYARVSPSFVEKFVEVMRQIQQYCLEHLVIFGAIGAVLSEYFCASRGILFFKHSFRLNDQRKLTAVLQQ